MSEKKLHYFNQDKPDESDILLKMAIKQGYVPETCLLAGDLVLAFVNDGMDACKGCEGPRHKCNGREK